MKKLKSILMLLLVALSACLAMSGCDKDGDDNTGGNNGVRKEKLDLLFGKFWQMTYYEVGETDSLGNVLPNAERRDYKNVNIELYEKLNEDKLFIYANMYSFRVSDNEITNLSKKPIAIEKSNSHIRKYVGGMIWPEKVVEDDGEGEHFYDQITGLTDETLSIYEYEFEWGGGLPSEGEYETTYYKRVVLSWSVDEIMRMDN